jgi:hypothetical protein
MMDSPRLTFAAGEVKAMHNILLEEKKEYERRDHDYRQYAKFDIPG